MTTAKRRKTAKKRVLLHVGCGRKRLKDLPDYFAAGWREIRYDIDEGCKPTIQGDITDLQGVEDATIDAIWSSHNIEHLFAHEAPVAIAEFQRVLKDDGFLIITCPDLKTACRVAGERGLDAALYTSRAGPITPRDILFGHQRSVQSGGHFMAHKNGFDLQSLNALLSRGGFKKVYGERIGYELWFIACNANISTDEARERLSEIKPKRLEAA